MPRKLAHFAVAAACLLLAVGCGDENGTGTDGTVFEPPAWVNNLGDASSSPSTGQTGGGDDGGVAFHGVRATVTDVAEPLIVPENNVVVQETQVTRNITATGTADDGSTFVTIAFTVLSTVAAPITVDLTVAPPGTDQANFFYSEGTTDSTGNVVTAVTSGELDLERWNDVQVRGSFAADFTLQDGTARSINDGIIDVRLSDS